MWNVRRNRPPSPRRGNVVLMAAGLMVMVFGFAAFSVDVGYIALTKTRMQVAADSGAMAAASELAPGLGMGATKNAWEVEAEAEEAAVELVGRHSAGGEPSIYLDGDRDLRLGQVVYDPNTGTWVKTWGIAPYNCAEVTVRRDQEGSGADGPLPLFFAPVVGTKKATLKVKAVSAILPAIGFRVVSGSTNKAGVLPFALDLETWEDLFNGSIDPGERDDFTYNEDGSVTSGPDGTLEVNLYPHGPSTMPPGNRGTLDIGSSSNSTSDVKRQIVHGLNDDDLSYFTNGEIKATWANPLWLNGDTGISAGFKEQLEQVKGLSRAIPIFDGMPTGNGNNATYKIVKFVGVRVVDVKLTGNPKWVMVQPGPVVDATAVPDKTGSITFDEAGVFTSPAILE